MKASQRKDTLTFLLYPCEENPDRVVAHCLELDVVAIENTMPKAILLLKELVEDLLTAAEQDGTIDQVYRPAPDKYWQMLATARPYLAPPRVKQHHIKAQPVRRVEYAMAL